MQKNLSINHCSSQMEREEALLCDWATKSRDSKGRAHPEEHDYLRTPFQRDRDRIIYSKSFRRLKHKTQVFLSPFGDHYRTRLTHTLEVSQIARTIARALRLNEDLSEAIALAHDIGHTPFGHCGERALNSVHPGGFVHAQHSLRVVDVVEQRVNKPYRGLNLTFEVRDGIVNHTGNNIAATPEGKIIKYADRIAYLNHDLDDAIRAGILQEDDLPKHISGLLGDTTSKRINALVLNLIEHSSRERDIVMSPDFYEALMEFRAFMFKRLYLGSVAKSQEDKAERIVQELYRYFLENTEKLPQQFKDYTDAHEAVKDYIAGMSDRYAIDMYTRLFIPDFWH